ncbi:MAG: hypothetical protein FJX72_04880, partial [Armatimonadetes bacterium]|nr:hypothetical protein [Armatimonadota bacterium]
MLGAVALAALVCLAGSPAQSREWLHRMEAFPFEAVEETPLRFRISYRAPEPVKLHAEVKDTSSVVHIADVREVSGEGVAEFAIVLPKGKFNGQLLVAYWFGDDWREPRIPIAHAGPVQVYTPEEAQRLAQMDRDAQAMRERLKLDASSPVVAVLSGGWAGRSAALADAYVRALTESGMRCVKLGPDEVSNRGVLKKDLIRLLVIPEARTYPGEGISALLGYLRAGGHLVALGAPALDRLVRRLPTPAGEEWVDEAQLTERMRNTPATRALLDMDSMRAMDWRRTANDMQAPCSWSQIGEDGVGVVLDHQIGNLTSWETLEATLNRPGAPGDNVVTFRARGGPDTTMLALELREKDQSRWIAVVPITNQWRRYALPTTAFRLWDPESRSGRAGPNDGLKLTA